MEQGLGVLGWVGKQAAQALGEDEDGACSRVRFVALQL